MGGSSDGAARKPRQDHAEAVDRDTLTQLMEQLQEGYVASVAATAGCALQIIGRDIFGSDGLIVRPPRSASEQETSVWVHLKCTYQFSPDPTRDTFSYQFTKRKYFDKLALVRDPKALLIVMTVPPRQLDWTEVSHDGLLVRRACYWAHLEGYESSAVKPTVQIPTKNIFDAYALIDILDKLDRGESLNG